MCCLLKLESAVHDMSHLLILWSDPVHGIGIFLNCGLRSSGKELDQVSEKLHLCMSC